MKTSESIIEIAKALAEFNKEITRIGKDGLNPHFKNQYATLDHILDTVRPILAKNGISVMLMPSGDGSVIEMKCLLIHVSGEFIEGPVAAVKPVKIDPQGLGSAMTYLKRYVLSSILGLSTGDPDDDGNAASTPIEKPTYVKQYNNHNTAGGSDLATEKQVQKIRGDIKRIASKAGLSERDFENQILHKYQINNLSDLKKSAASSLIDYLSEQK
jgi:hypothetical protein